MKVRPSFLRKRSWEPYVSICPILRLASALLALAPFIQQTVCDTCPANIPLSLELCPGKLFGTKTSTDWVRETSPCVVFLIPTALGLDSTAPHLQRCLLAKLQLDARQVLGVNNGQAKGQMAPTISVGVGNGTRFQKPGSGPIYKP